MSYQGLPVFLQDTKEHLRQIATKINTQLNRGKFNCTTSLTLTALATTTNFIDERIGNGSYIDFMPLTANAATAKITGIYITNQLKGSCTVNHASSVHSDQNFIAVILG